MALYTYPAHRLFAECNNSMDLNILTVPKGRESPEEVQSGMGESMKREEPRVLAGCHQLSYLKHTFITLQLRTL